MKYKIIERRDVTVVCLRYTGPYGKGIEEYWKNVFAPWLKLNKLEDTPHYGIAQDNPLVTPAEKCRYDACAEVPEDYQVNGSAFKMRIPGGKYAVFSFKGRIEHLGMAWQRILCDWLPKDMHVNDLRPAFTYHRVGCKYSFEYGAIECELCIPIVPPVVE